MKRTLFPGYSVGTDAYEDIKEICPAYGKKAAIIGGKHALAAAQDKIIAAAKEAGIEIIGPFWYGGEASVENIEMLKPKVADADMIFAVGGGKAIDTCKVLSHSTTNISGQASATRWRSTMNARYLRAATHRLTRTPWVLR